MIEAPSSRDRRRFSRYRCEISATVQDDLDAGQAQLVTSDVSRHGAFLLTDQPRPEHELLRLRFDIPAHGALEVVGTVVRRVLPGDSGADDTQRALIGPGMGVDFLALSREAKDVWDRFVFGLRAGPQGVVRLEHRPRTPPMRRRHVRHLSCFLVRLRDKERLRELYTRDIGAGGMLLEMPHTEATRDEVELILVHPDSEQEFHLWGRVRRVERPTPGSGASHDGDATQGAEIPQEANATRGATPPPPEGATRGATPPPPEGATRGATPPPPEGATRGATPPPPEGATRGQGPSDLPQRVAVEFERLNTAREAALLAFIETGVNYLDHTTPEEEHHRLVGDAARVAPDSPESLVALGHRMLEVADMQLAVNAFRSALTMDANCAEAHRGLHLALMDLDRPAEAAQHLAHYERLVLVSDDG